MKGGKSLNDDEERQNESDPLLAAPQTAGKRRFYVQAIVALSVATLGLWGALLGSAVVDHSIVGYTPHSSCIDIIFVDAIRALVVAAVVLRSTDRALAVGLNVSLLALAVLLTKPWVYRAWASHPGSTAALIVAVLASLGHVVLVRCVANLDNPPKGRLRWRSVKKILRPYFIPTGCRNKMLVIITWLMLIFGRACQIVTPIVLGAVVSRLTKKPPEVPTRLILLYCFLNFMPRIFTEVQDILYVKVWQRAYAEVADTTFRHLHSLSLEWHLKKKMGNVMRSVDRGMSAADSLMYYAMLFLLPAVGSAIASFVVFAVHFDQPEIAAICFLGFTLYLWVTLVVTLWRRKYRERMNKHDNKVHDLATDSMINFETVKCYANEEYEARRYIEGIVDYQRSSYTSQASVSLLNVSQSATIQLSMLGSLMVAAYAVRDGDDDFDAGSFVAVQSYVMTIFQPLSYLGMIYNSIINSMVDIQNLSDLLSEAPDVVDAPDARALRPPQRAADGIGIEFRGVGFRYPSQGEGQGIRNISFVVPPGTTTAIVGKTGSGKTTITRLLFRFYDVLEGQIVVGGQDIAKLTQKSLRRAIGIVPQDCCMFNDTIIANIRYGNLDASDEEVYEAAKKARVYDMVERLEGKWTTVVGERGLKLSGGEKQRLAIARCLLKDPPIVVLDESTAALDSRTEREIQESLRCLEGRTMVVIAHRLSTVKDADQIIVMDAGAVVERGTHEELLKDRSSVYTAMWQAQMSSSAAENAATAVAADAPEGGKAAAAPEAGDAKESAA